MECTWTADRQPAVRTAPMHRAIAPGVAAACVAVGILLALVDDNAREPASPSVAPAGAGVPAFVADSAAAHRKQVLDERRARFELAHGRVASDVAARR